MTLRSSIVAGGFLAVALANAASAATPATNPWWEDYEHNSQQVSLPDGRKMNLYCEGEGGPVVILESGLGGGAWDWRLVQDEIAKTTRVCAYDRAGIGGSDAGPMPRDTKAIVADLEALLKSANVPAPYVLVGHSLGSYDVRLFADRNLPQVAGMVLVDPAADGQVERFNAVVPKLMHLQTSAYDPFRRCLALIEASALKPGAAGYAGCVGSPPPDMPSDLQHFHFDYGVSADHYRATLSELGSSMTADSAETLAARRSYADLPLIVLTAENTSKSAALSPAEQVADAQAWNDMHDEIAHLSRKGVNRVVTGSGHFIQLERPQVVIDAVKEVVAAARRAEPPPHATTRMIETGGHKIAFHVTPGRGFTIVLDAGGGLDSSYWDAFVPELVKRTHATIITYDRAGSGASDEVGGPWSVQSATTDLEVGLKTLHATRHVILVSHSLAGEIATYLAQRHPNWLEGAVLVDANVPDLYTDQFIDGMAPMIAAMTKSAPPSRSGRLMLALGASFTQTSRAFHQATWPASVPVVVIVSEKTPFATAAEAQWWKDAHAQFAGRASNRRFVIAARSSHDVAHDRPDVILDGISEVSERLRH